MDTRPAPDGSPSPLSLRDISPHCGESPFTREPNLIPQSIHFVRSQLTLQGSLNNPSVRSWTRVQLLTGARPLCHYVTFPHTVGNHPLQGSLLNPSVYSLRSQTAPDGRESPLSLRDISPHRGESPFTREPFDISPHRGESPYLM